MVQSSFTVVSPVGFVRDVEIAAATKTIEETFALVEGSDVIARPGRTSA